MESQVLFEIYLDGYQGAVITSNLKGGGQVGFQELEVQHFSLYIFIFSQLN